MNRIIQREKKAHFEQFTPPLEHVETLFYRYSTDLLHRRLYGILIHDGGLNLDNGIRDSGPSTVMRSGFKISCTAYGCRLE